MSDLYVRTFSEEIKQEAHSGGIEAELQVLVRALGQL